MSIEDDRETENPAKLRNLAVPSMLQAAAEDRIRRANATKSRPAEELKDLHLGDWVNI